MDANGGHLFIEVSNAGRAVLNGIYVKLGSLNGRPKYSQVGGTGLIFFVKFWKITNGKWSKLESPDGWCYGVSDATGALPPMGGWRDDSENEEGTGSPPKLAWYSHRDAEIAEGCSMVPAHVQHHWEDMFDDEESKDVTVEARDGQVRVHSALLRQVSEPLKAMLSSGMRESTTKTIRLESYPCDLLKFFFRHVYTGQKDPDDWHGESTEEDIRDLMAQSKLSPEVVHELRSIFDCSVESNPQEKRRKVRKTL
eukprot:TRINITY_DN23982_c0_g1_i2.p1 TRINITY_DN23982_c0_g1~~TRINITY_DN23982_c0_g1_i2.p1  ORF type:complete len:253 (-),score=22.93 TRINITY_DN23982_c0_g1_i2:184-942(-)